MSDYDALRESMAMYNPPKKSWQKLKTQKTQTHDFPYNGPSPAFNSTPYLGSSLLPQSDRTRSELDLEGNTSSDSDSIMEEKCAPEHTYPDGGKDAWLQCVGLFFVSVATWGLINSFGGFQLYYKYVLIPHKTDSQISWIGSFQMFLMIFLGAPIAPLVDSGYFRHLMASGSFLIVLGMMLTSIAKEYWQLFLSQGVCTGIGMGLIYMPAMVCVNTWFNRRKGIALGLGIMGSSAAGVAFPLLMRRWIDNPNIGFAWTVRIITFIVLAALIVVNIVMKPNFATRGEKSKPKLAEIFDTSFNLYAIGAVLGFLGVFIPFFYISSYALLQGIGRDSSLNLLSIMNGASVLGRVLPNLLADKIGSLNSSIPFAACSGILMFCWISIKSESGLIALAVLYGFFSGAFVSLPPMVIGTMTKDVRHMSTKVGIGFLLCSPAMLAGPPIAGALWNAGGQAGGNAIGTQVFAGSTALASALFFVAARISMAGGVKLGVKV